MATRSNIGILNTDGSVYYIYCHYDGYPDNIAPQLKMMSWEEVSYPIVLRVAIVHFPSLKL